MRTLIRNLPTRREVTIFLSSHLLSEVEQIATHFSIISQGQLRFEGTPEQLRMRSGQLIVVEADQPERAQSLLLRAGSTVTRQGRRLQIADDGLHQPAQINTLLVQAGIEVSHLARHHMTLEEVFLDLTAELETLVQ
jgi:lantibiotic transport system ATP-binding protein